MTTKLLKCVAVGAAVIFGSIGFEAQAAWTYDSGAGTLSDGDYTFNVKVVTLDDPSASGTSVEGLQITGLATAGTGETIDFTSAELDTGYDVISISAPRFLNEAPCTTFIAPAVMSLGQQAFQSNTKIENVTVSDKITTFGYLTCSGASNLKTFLPTRLPYIVEMTGNSAGQAFYGAKGLTGDFDFPNMTKIENQVFYQTSITSVKMPKIQVVGAHSFRECKKLTGDLKFDDLESIGHCAFMGCGITSFVAPKAMLTSDGYQFGGCGSLTNVVVSQENTVIGWNAFSSCAITSFDAPKATTIGACAFQNCQSLTNINASLVTTLGDSAFYICKKLEKLDMPKLVSIGSSGVRDTALKELIAPGVTKIGAYTFMGCKSITNIQLGASCATNYGEWAYKSCEKLAKLEPWPSFLNLTNTYDNKGNVFLIDPLSECNSLVGSIELSGPAGLHTIPSGWMNSCNNITSITIRTPWITNVVNWTVRDLAPGAVIYWNTQKAPISFGRAFFSKDKNNRARIIVKGDVSGWGNTVYSAALTELTDTDKKRSDWPGKRTFGLITNPDATPTYLVDGRSGLCIRIQ